jgi:hypothetical protein
MNLDVPWCVRFVWDHDLRFRIAEGNRKRVIGVALMVFFDPILEFRIIPDGINN